MKRPDFVPIGFRLMQDGERITESCVMWSAVNGVWIEVTTLLIGQQFREHDFVNVYFAIPSNSVLK